MTRLLAAEHPLLPAQGLEHVAVADRSRDHPHAALGHQPMEAEVRHHGDGDDLHAEREREDREDLIAVHDVAALVDGEHAVAVAVERDAEIERLAPHELLQAGQVGRPAADVDVRPVGLDADRVHLGAELLEEPGRDRGEGAVGAVDADPEP